MKRYHFKNGCGQCFARRDPEDITSKKYDIYFYDRNSKSYIRAGLCKTCFESEDLDYKKIKENIQESEEKMHEIEGGPESELDLIRKAHFTAHISYDDFWSGYEGSDLFNFVSAKISTEK